MKDIEGRFLAKMTQAAKDIGGNPINRTAFGEVAILEAGVREIIKILEEKFERDV